MPQTATLQITLSAEEVAFVKQRVASGEFSSESEVLSTGVQRLAEEAAHQARWEQDVLIPIIDRFQKNPDSSVPIEEVERDLEARRPERKRSS